MYRNSQFAFFSEMSKYAYMLVTDCWFLHMLHSLAIFKLFLNVLPGQTWNLCLFHESPLKNDNTDLVSRKRAQKKKLNRYICLVHHPQILPMDVHETLLNHIIHAQGNIYLIECASITSVSLIMLYFHCKVKMKVV